MFFLVFKAIKGTVSDGTTDYEIAEEKARSHKIKLLITSEIALMRPEKESVAQRMERNTNPPQFAFGHEAKEKQKCV